MPPKIKTNILKLKKRSIKKPKPNNLNVITQVIKGRDELPESVLKTLSSYGDVPIIAYSIKRTPVSKLLTTALSTLSREFKDRLQKSEYDELFHLYLEITLESGKKLLIEKNAVINIITSVKRPQEEIRIINKTPTGLTLNVIMEKTKKMMGSKFLTYSANNNNCQDFIVSIMRVNKIGSTDDIKFVKQDTKFLFKNLPYLRKFSNTVTTIGARVDVLKNII